MAQAANVTNTPPNNANTGAGALFNMLAGRPQPQDGKSVADQFKDLLAQMAGRRDQANANPVNQSSAADVLSGQPPAVTDAAAPSGLVPLQNQIQEWLQGDTVQDADLTAAQIAQIAELLQQYPALQPILTEQVDAQQLQGISDALAKGEKQPDFSGLNLSDEQQSQLLDLAQKPDASKAMQNLAAQVAAKPELAASLPQALQDFMAQMQKNAETKDKFAPIVEQVPAKDDAPVNAVEAKPLPAAPITRERYEAAKQGAAEAHTDEKLWEKNNSLAMPTTEGMKKPVLSAVPHDGVMAPSMFAAKPENLSTQFLNADQTNAILQVGRNGLTAGDVQGAFPAAQSGNAATLANPAAMQLAIQLQRNAAANNNSFVMQLHPADLGQIQVSLRFNGNKVQAKILAEKQETLDFLQQDQGTLTKALQSAGLQADAGSLEFSLGGSAEQFAQQSKKNMPAENAFGTMIANPISEDNRITSSGGSQWTTLGTGRVDVRL